MIKNIKPVEYQTSTNTFLIGLLYLLSSQYNNRYQFILLSAKKLIISILMIGQTSKKGVNLLKKFLWNIDLFSSPQLLRHKCQTNYSTLTGGCLSLIIIVIFGTILINDSVSVLTKNQIIAKDSLYYLEDPTYTSFKLDSQSKIMIGIGITGLDLTKNSRYFDIKLSTLVYKYGKQVDTIYHTLQPCKYQNWANINSNGASAYTQLGLSKFLCPTQNLTIELQGKYTSESFKLLELKVLKCKNQTDPSRPCVSEEVVKSSPAYALNYYFMNAYMNSGDAEPVGRYLQDRNYFGFTLDSTSVNNLYITQNIVSTDNSLFPWGDIENSTVLLVKQLAEVKNRVTIIDQYIGVYLRKSPYYIVSERSFKKIQDLLSGVGGLFGFAIAFFFFMSYYTEASYEIEMGDQLFYYKKQNGLKSKGFNFFFFVAYLVYQFLKQLFCLQIPWQRMRIYYECREEVREQLDVSLLMNKITFLQKCMNAIFEKHQFRAIYIQQKPDVKQAETLRKNHGLNKIIHKNSKKINNKIQQKVNVYKEKMLNRIKTSKKQQKQLKVPSIENFLKQFSIQNEEKYGGEHLSQKQKTQIELKQIVANFIMQDFLKQNSNNVKQQNEIKMVSEQQRQSKNQPQSEQQVDLQDIAEQGHQSLQFINTALKDIKKIEQQSKQGNVISQRIYNQLNNDITKEQLIVLKCLQTIVQNKQKNQNIQRDNNGRVSIESRKSNVYNNLIRLISEQLTNKEKDQKGKQNGLQIVLQSNNRIETKEYI